jgi:hypothetical protein
MMDMSPSDKDVMTFRLSPNTLGIDELQKQ